MQDALVTWLQSIPEVRKVNYSEMTANTLSGLNLLIAYVSMGIIVIQMCIRDRYYHCILWVCRF